MTKRTAESLIREFRTEVRAHYFDTIIECFMPQRPSERIDEAVRKVLLEMAPPKGSDE